MKKKILFTGATGYIGLKLLKRIHKFKNYEIYCSIHKNKNLIKNTKIFKSDLLNIKTLKREITKLKPEILIHFAAFPNPALNEQFKNKSKQMNYTITKNLHDSLDKNCHVIFLSTDKIYNKSQTLCSENNSPRPNGEYAKNKLKSERLIIKKFKKHHIFRLPIVHSNGYKKSNAFIDKAIIKLKKFETVIAAKNIYRSFLDIDDFTRFMTKILTSNNYGLYNLGSKKFSYYSRIKKIAASLKMKTNNHLKGEVNKQIKPTKQVLNSNKVKKKFKVSFK